MDEEKTIYLIPILTERELDPDFVEEARKADKVILLYVMDSDRMTGLPSGFMGGRIKSAEAIIDQYKKKLKGKEVDGFVEWGHWETKLKAFAIIKKVDLVLMRESEAAESFSRELKKEKVKFKIL